MDMLPPQAPPAQIRQASQDAPEILQRLAATQAGITALRTSLPAIPDSLTQEQRTPFLASLDRWATENRATLAQHLSNAMRDDALLRGIDGTLAAGDAAQLASFARSAGTALPAGMEARELMFGGHVYAGSLVLARPGAAFVFLPDRGWERFDSLALLHDELEERTRHELILRDTLPGLRVADVDAMVREDRFVDSRPAVANDLIAAMAGSMLAVLREQAADAWGTQTEAEAASGAPDALRAALNLHAKLDVESMLHDRQRRLLEHWHASRLAGAPAPVAAGWREAAAALRLARREADAAQRHAAEGVDPMRPADMNDPDAVRTYRDALIAANEAAASGPGHKAAAALRQAQAAMAAADARLSYWLPSEPRRFIDDHAERGYLWLAAVVDAPAPGARRKVDGHEIVASQFTYRGAVLEDVFAVHVRERGSAARVVLYTPGAPDGHAIREFEDAAHAARAFLYEPRFESYLLDRLPASQATVDGNGVRHFAIPDELRRTNWVLQQPGREGSTFTAEAFGEREVKGDLFEALHATTLSRAVLDMSELEDALRSARPAFGWQLAKGVAEASSPAARVLRELVAGLDRGMRALWRLEDSIRAGDSAQAVVDATESYVNLMSLAHPAHAFARPGLYARAVYGGTMLTQAAVAAPEPLAAFDARYAARGVDMAGTRPDVRGIHTLGDRRYILQAGTPWEVRFDASNATWRLFRPGAVDAVHGGPPIQWSQAGWRLRSDIGLRGGRTPATPGPSRSTPGVRTVQDGEVARLSAYQQGEFLRVLRQRLGGARADEMHIEVQLMGGRPLAVGRNRWNAWHDALEAAHRLPRAAPAPGAIPQLQPTLPWREVPAAEWPDAVWYYPPAFAGALDEPSVFLPAVRVRGSGLTGLVASPLDPALQQARSGAANGRWVQVNLRQMRGQHTPDGQPQLRVFVNDAGADPHYIIRTAGEEQGMFLVLRPGEFHVGS